MRRREFVSLLGGAAAWPLVAEGQQGERNIVTSRFLQYKRHLASPLPAGTFHAQILPPRCR
jgi:hypothetical protein